MMAMGPGFCSELVLLRAEGGRRVTSLTFFTVVVALVALERLAELVVSKRNAAWSFARGGVETGQGHYPVMVVLHTGLLVAMLVEAYVVRPDVPAALAGSMLVLVVASQALRWWCIATLGPRWNTRVIIVPGLPPVTGGPYRFFSPPQLRGRRGRGRCAAAAAPVVDHRAGLHRRQRGAADGADPRRGRRAGHPAPGTGRAARPGPAVHDLVVAGGGPVGLAAALHARRAGLDVVVVEPRAGVVDKACGEGLMPGALARLADLGVDGRGRRPGRHPLPRRAAQRRRAVPSRAGARRAAHDLARGAVAPPRRGGRRGASGGRALGGRPRFAPARRRRAGALPGRRRRAALPRAPAARASTPPVRAAPSLRPALPPARSRRGATSSRCTGHPHAEAYVTPVAPDLVGLAVLSGRRAPFDRAARRFHRPARTGGGRRTDPRAGRRAAAPAGAAPGRRAGAARRRRRRLRRRAHR